MAARALGIKEIQAPAFCSQDTSCIHLGCPCFSARRMEEMTSLHRAKPTWIPAGVVSVRWNSRNGVPAKTHGA